MKRIVLAGLEGKMGSFLLEGLKQQSDLKIVAGVSEVAKLTEEIPIYNDIETLLKEVEFDIYVDFTAPSFSAYAIEEMFKAHKAVVVGTTGFAPEVLEHLSVVSKKYEGRGIIAPNFSMGAILLVKFAKVCSQFFDHFTVHEFHHLAKKDNPSGTATYLANTIDKELQRDPNTTAICGFRLPGVLATHQITVSDETQKLELTHQSNNRHSFEKGVLFAIHHVESLNELVYGLENLID